MPEGRAGASVATRFSLLEYVLEVQVEDGAKEVVNVRRKVVLMNDGLPELEPWGRRVRGHSRAGHSQGDAIQVLMAPPIKAAPILPFSSSHVTPVLAAENLPPLTSGPRLSVSQSPLPAPQSNPFLSCP